MSGKILVESTKGEGSSFRVILPRQADRSTSMEKTVMMEQSEPSVISSMDRGTVVISNEKES